MYTEEQWKRICEAIEQMVLNLRTWTKQDSLLVDWMETLAQDMVQNGYGLTEIEFYFEGLLEAIYGE